MESKGNKYTVKSETEITLADKRVPIVTTNSSLTPETVVLGLKSMKVALWFENLDLAQVHLISVEVRDIFLVGPSTVGFVSLLCRMCEKKYEPEVNKDPNAKVPLLPGYFFIQGDSVAVLPIIIEQETKTKYVLLVEQFRLPVGRKMLEIPTGQIDEESSFQKVALKELEEDAGISLSKDDLKELITIGTSVGISDQKVKIFYTEVEKTGEEMMDIDTKVTGKLQQGQMMHLKLVELDIQKLLKMAELLDAKLVAALLAYTAKK